MGTFRLPQDARGFDSECADLVASCGVRDLVLMVVWLYELVDGSGHGLVLLWVALGEEGNYRTCRGRGKISEWRALL